MTWLIFLFPGCTLPSTVPRRSQERKSGKEGLEKSNINMEERKINTCVILGILLCKSKTIVI